MSRSTSLLTSYLQALIFAVLGIRCYLSWRRQRDKRSAHLAWAAGFFGSNSLLSALTTTFIDSTKNEVAPRWEQIVSGILIYLAIYGFLLFLSDFIPYPKWIHGVLVAVTGAGIVFSFLEKPALRVNFKSPTNCPFQNIPGVDNPVPYKTYIYVVLGYLGIAFGVLAVAFLLYGARSAGLARFRMLSIGSGFLLLCGVIGLVPVILFGNPCAGTPKTILNVITYVALISAPLLLIGFAPPRMIRERFGGPQIGAGV
jgi:hypothetical protein